MTQRPPLRSAWPLLAALALGACLEGDPNPYDRDTSEDEPVAGSSNNGSSGSSSSGGFGSIKASGKCSQSSGTMATLVLDNRTQRALRIYWVDYNCQEQYYGDVAAGQSFTVTTHATHPWRLRDLVTETLVFEYIAGTAATQNVAVVEP